jgi:hypothetical protein
VVVFGLDSCFPIHRCPSLFWDRDPSHRADLTLILFTECRRLASMAEERCLALLELPMDAQTSVLTFLSYGDLICAASQGSAVRAAAWRIWTACAVDPPACPALRRRRHSSVSFLADACPQVQCARSHPLFRLSHLWSASSEA